MSLKIVVIDYGIGNVRSIVNAFVKIGVSTSMTRDPDVILNADGVVLPGVGAFAHGMRNLHKFSLVEVIKKYSNSGKPLLGICLGMQMLMTESEEFGVTKGIALIEGSVVKLPVNDPENDKLPHVSWNEIEKAGINWDKTIFSNIKNSTDMYFVHSYVAVPDNKENILSTTNYSGFDFCSSIKKNNIYGCQFNPEKSAQDGLKVIENFVKICRENRNV